MPPPSPPPARSRALELVLAAAALAVAGARALWRWGRAGPPGRRPALFPRWSNAALLAALGAGAAALVVVVGVLLWRAESEPRAGFVVPAQPVPFSHQIHVQGLEIDCRYCHSTVEKGPSAGMPSTSKCVPCHSDVWLQSEPFEAVRQSLDADLPIPWRRVHDLPDFTYFHHGAHVTSGVGCETCHGRVDQMRRVMQVETLSMEWCLQCHRRPEPFLRPRSEITTMGWTPAELQAELGARLRLEYRVAEMTDCTTCHR